MKRITLIALCVGSILVYLGLLSGCTQTVGTETGNPIVIATAMASQTQLALDVGEYWHPTSFVSPLNDLTGMKKSLASSPDSVHLGDSMLVIIALISKTDTSFSHIPQWVSRDTIISFSKLDTFCEVRNAQRICSIDSLFSLDTITTTFDTARTDTILNSYSIKTISILTKCNNQWGKNTQIDSTIYENGQRIQSGYITYDPCSNVVVARADGQKNVGAPIVGQLSLKPFNYIYITPEFTNFGSRITTINNIVVEKISFTKTDSLLNIYQIFPSPLDSIQSRTVGFILDAGQNLSSPSDDQLFRIKRRVDFRSGPLKSLGCMLSFDETTRVKGLATPKRAIAEVEVIDTSDNVGSFYGVVDVLAGLHGQLLWNFKKYQIDVDTNGFADIVEIK